MHFIFLVFCWNIFINSCTLIFRALNENKIRKLPQRVFYGLTALQQLWVYRLNFFCEITRRFTYSLRTGDFTVPSGLFQVKKRKRKKSEFLQFRGGLISDSFIVFSRWILNYYNSIITIIISIHFTCKPSSLTVFST